MVTDYVENKWQQFEAAKTTVDKIVVVGEIARDGDIVILSFAAPELGGALLGTVSRVGGGVLEATAPRVARFAGNAWEKARLFGGRFFGRVPEVSKAEDLGFQTLGHSAIKFSQSSVNGVNEIMEIMESMKISGWLGDPIDVVKMPDGSLITIDNTRLLAASRANISVEAVVHDAGAAEDFSRRFTTMKGGVPRTWEEAIMNRINKQNTLYRNTYPNGSQVIGTR